MKKAFAIMLVSAVIGTAAFAQGKPGIFSIGVGGLFTSDWTDWYSKDDLMKSTYEDNRGDDLLLGGGFNVFFDAKYVALNVGMVFGSDGSLYKDADDDYKVGGKMAYNTTALRIGLMGKYPFAINDKFSLFPELGIDYEIALGAKQDGEKVKYYDKDGEESSAAKEASALWFKLGVGADIALTDRLYLRPEFLYGIRLHSKNEKDALDADVGSKKTSDYIGVIGHGLDVKVSLGIRL